MTAHGAVYNRLAMARVLVVTEAREGELVGAFLKQWGHDPALATSAQEALEMGRQPPDLVLVGLKEGDTSWLAQFKGATQAPILALVPRGKAPPSAADDFLFLPWDSQELLLRLDRLLRPPEGPEILRCGDLVMDRARYEVSVGRRRVELTFKEYELLEFLATRQGRVFTRDAILTQVWGYDYLGVRGRWMCTSAACAAS